MTVEATPNSLRALNHRLRFRRIIGLIALVTVVFIAGCNIELKEKTIPEVSQSQSMPLPSDWRDTRYCEIIPVFRNRATFNVEVYNTMGLNECPADLWAEMDAEAMAETYDAHIVKLNGPRYWVISELIAGGATEAGKTVDFNGIEMTLRAIIETKLWEGTVGEAFYQDNEVQRTTTYVYRAGNMVYELTSPEGDVYRMQSYAQIIDPTLTIADLETLGDRLDLPEGWSYQARVLTEDSKLIADGLAYVINDDLANSYQKVLGDVLETASAQDGEVSLLEYHDAYWVSEVKLPDQPVSLTVINDMHVDPATNLVTVYGQTRLLGKVVAPPQVGPDECTESANGETVCFHPNGVYLNGSGQELMEADGTGGWWTKHAWVLGGEGFESCETKSEEEPSPFDNLGRECPKLQN